MAVSVRPVAAVVTPDEAGALLPQCLQSHGWRVVVVTSESALARHWAMHEVEVIQRPDQDRVIAELRALGASLVLPGHERGVMQADALAEALGVAGNGTALSAARRHKGLMAAAVAEHGLAVPKYTYGDRIEPLIDWVDSQLAWPVVAKPAAGYSGHGVRWCYSSAELRQAAGRILGQRNPLGEINREVVVQEPLSGPEYVVDTVSADGQHRLSAIWRYRWWDGGPEASAMLLFDVKELVTSDDATSQALLAYVRGVLDAVGVRYGPAHCELKWVDGRPLLIEVGARLHGGKLAHRLAEACLEDSQVKQMVRAAIDPLAFLGERMPRPSGRPGSMVVLKHPRPGEPWRGDLEAVRELQSCFHLQLDVQRNEPSPPVIGLALLASRDCGLLETDEGRIRQLAAAAVEAPASAQLRRRNAEPGGLRFEVITELARVAPLVASWHQLLAASRANRTFSSPTWFVEWCRIEPAWRPCVATAWRDGRLAGVLPLVIHSGENFARFPGELADYNDLIAARGDQEVMTGLLQTALSRCEDGLRLNCLRADSDLLAASRALGLEVNPEAFCWGPGATVCPYAQIEHGYADYLAQRSLRTRRELRVSQRRALAAGAQVSELVSTDLPPAQLPRTFLSLHYARFERSCFDGRRERVFVEQVLPRLYAERSLRVFAVRLRDAIVSIGLFAIAPDGLGIWNGGFRADAAPLGVGRLVINAAIEQAAVEGLREFDFLRGAEPYKYLWATHERVIGRLDLRSTAATEALCGETR